MTKFSHFVSATLLLICSQQPYAAQTTQLSQALTPEVHVTGQMSVEKFNKLLATQQFKSIIVNRPDEEIGNIVNASTLRTLAEKTKVSLVYQPVKSGQISQADIEEFAQYYNTLPKPVLMVCKSGNRSSVLFKQAQSQGLLNE